MDERERLNILISGLVGNNRELYLKNTRYHAFIKGTVHWLMELSDAVAAGQEALEEKVNREIEGSVGRGG